jgi:hypothetical protein
MNSSENMLRQFASNPNFAQTPLYQTDFLCYNTRQNITCPEISGSSKLASVAPPQNVERQSNPSYQQGNSDK